MVFRLNSIMQARLRDVPLRYWWEATRPRMFAVWLAAGIIPGAVALLDGVFEIVTFLLETLLCWMLLSLSCWADEYGDLEKGVDNENRLGPIRPVQRGDIPPRTMLKGCILLAAASCAVGFVLVAWSVVRLHSGWGIFAAYIAAGAVCIWAAFTYTMGKRPYGYHGWGDFASYFFFGPVAGVGGYWLYANTMNWLVLLPASGAAILLALTINLQNVRDFDNDAANGKRTTAVFLGKRGAEIYHWAMTIVACACYLMFPICAGQTNPLNYLFALAFIPLIKHCIDFSRIVHTPGSMARLDTLMSPLVRAMAYVAVLFCLCILL